MNRPKGNTLIPPSTPLHVADLVFLLVRETLTNPGSANWPFKISDDFDDSRVALDTVYNKDSGVFGKKPIIIVSRGGQSTSPVANADLAALNTYTWNKKESTIISSSVEIKVVSREPKEVDILSQHMYNFCAMLRVVLPGILGVLVVNSVSMTPVMPIEHEDHMYNCDISMNYQMQYIWRHEIPQIILKSIKMVLNEEISFITTK